jgi:hypothetical protein
MTTDQAKQLAENALNTLIEALEKGQSEALRNYLAAMGRFRSYSFRNCLLIASQMPGASRVAGFQTWLKLRRYVRKGEKGIVILAPMVGRKRAEEDNVGDTDETRVFGFRAAHVFDGLSRDSRESHLACAGGLRREKLVRFGRLTEGGRSPTGVSRQTTRRDREPCWDCGIVCYAHLRC